MNKDMLIFVLTLVILFLICVIIYQYVAVQIGMRRKMTNLAGKLQEIMDRQSNENLLVFTENKELREFVVQINRLLEEYRKTRADFARSELSSKKMLSNISHDIRTPMTVVLGYLEIMRLNGSTTEDMLVKTENKAQAVMNLINEFFTLAKLEAGDMDIELTRMNICEVCRENILDFYEILMKNSFEVEVTIPETALYVMGNQAAFYRIMTNLISNAVRYGIDGHYLGITVREEKEYVYIDVTDRGKGMDRASVSRVFDRLYTMEDSRNREVQGNGLGLTIAKNLAEQMGGNIFAESIPNERTTFSVQLKKMTY